MAKLVKNYYYGKNGEKKVNSYFANISKEVLNKTNIKEDDEIKIYSEKNKIIIERA